MTRFYSSLLLLFLLTGIAAAEIRVYGYIVDAGSREPLIGANLNVLNQPYGAATNLDGYYVIVGLPPGLHEIRVSYQGYKPADFNLVVNEFDEIYQDFELEASPLVLEEVVVTTERETQELQKMEVYTGEVRLNKAMMKMTPMLIESDVLRSFLYVPGVLPSNDFSSDLNVRGSSGSENLIMLDGVEVYNPNHMGGVFSSFIPSTVKHADLQRSSYGAEHGGRLGAVMNIVTKEGNRREFSTDITLGLLSSSLLLEGPAGGLGSWMLAGRRTYLDLASKAFTDTEIPYHFTDFQARGNLDLSQDDRLSFTGYYGDDVFDLGSIKFSYGNRAVTGNWRHIHNSALFSKLICSYTRYFSSFDFGGDEMLREENALNDVTLRALTEYHWRDKVYLEGGIVLKEVKTFYDFWYATRHEVSMDMAMSEFSTYLRLTWKPTYRWIIEPGLRLASYRTEKMLEFENNRYYLRLEPRLGAKYFLTDRLRAKAAWGFYNQGLIKATRDGMFYSAVWTTLDSTAAPASAYHYALGFEFDVDESTFLEIEGYFKEMAKLREMKIGELADEYNYTAQDMFHFGDGNAFGVDLALQRTRGRWTGQAGYSISWAYRQFDELHDGDPYYTAWDKRHNLQLLSSFRTSYQEKPRRWPLVKWGIFKYNETDINLTVQSSSGPRYNKPGMAYLIESGASRGSELFHTWNNYNGSRLDPYLRIDLAYAWIHNKPNSSFQMKMGVLNILNLPNYWSITFDESVNPPEENKTKGAPLMPSFELNWRF